MESASAVSFRLIIQSSPKSICTIYTGNNMDTMVNEKTRKENKVYCTVKRLQDIFLSAIALIILFPILIIIALIIVIDDPHGGAIYAQTRVGKDGKHFRFFKFRTMFADADSRLEFLIDHNEMDGPAFKMKDDPRITRVGRFFRKSALDELPQLINVLLGDMSIVGPRPPLPREVERYTPYQMQRLLVTPGLTCFWQISPRRNSMAFDDWVEMDLKYIRQRSFCLDWKLIFATIPAMLKGYGE